MVAAWSTTPLTSTTTSRRKSAILWPNSRQYNGVGDSSSSCYRLFSTNNSKSEQEQKDEDDKKKESLKKEQEQLMEQLALSGAERIAAMSIPERTKRAMLAEAVEDRIFELTDVLEKLLLLESGGGGDGPLISEKHRREALEVAQQTKALQIQYEELVSGRPSSVLKSLESVMGGGETKKDVNSE
jgi:hypothetical protein